MNGFKTSNAAFLATSSHLSNPLHQQMSNFPSQHCRGRLLGACATAGFHQRNLARTFTRQQGDIINMISDTLLINIHMCYCKVICNHDFIPAPSVKQ